MAKQTQQSINLIDIFSEFKELKNIDRQTFINVLEDSFRNVITKMYGTDANYDVIINPDKGDLEIYRNRLVMEDDDVANPDTQVGITEALQLDDEAEIGEEVTDKVEFASFGHPYAKVPWRHACPWKSMYTSIGILLEISFIRFLTLQTTG